jgi:hypothetical protein
VLSRLVATLFAVWLTACGTEPPPIHPPVPAAEPVTVTVPVLPPEPGGVAPVPEEAGPHAGADPTAVPAANADASSTAQPERCTLLPAARPPGLVFRYWQKIHPPAPWEGLEIHGPATPCPRTIGPRIDLPLPCREVQEATIDALFGEFKRRRFDQVEPVRRYPSAHRLWRTLEVIWGDRFCVVSENSSWAVPEGAQKDFARLIDAVVKAAR